MFQNTTQRNVFWFTFTLGIGWALYRLFTSTGYILDDEATHYIKSRSAWTNTSIFFDGWTRAGRNLIHAPIAIFGLTATRVFTLLLAGIAVWLTAKSAKHIGIKSIWAIPVLMLFQSWFPDLSYSVLTQTPFMIVWILGIYLAQKDRLYLASICFGYLSLIRHEGILLTALWGIWVSFQPGGILYNLMKRKFSLEAIKRDLTLAFFTVLAILIYNVANYFFDGSIPFLVYFNSEPTDYYGSGPIYHYASLLLPALGLFSLPLAIFGSFYIKKDLPQWSLILFTYVSYFAVHSVIFWAGKFASGGYFHFLMPMAPLFAMLGAKAFDVIEFKYKKHGNTIVLSITALIMAQGFHMIQQQGMYQWQAVIAGQKSYEGSFFNPPMTPEQRGLNMREAIHHVDQIRKDEPVTGNHPQIDIHFDNLHTSEAIARDWGDIQNFEKGTYFIWDQRLSELRENHSREKFDSSEWYVIKTWDNERFKKADDPKKKFSTIIFKKVN